MRIILEDIPTDRQEQVLAQLEELGFSAHVEKEAADLEIIEASHIQLILERRQDAELSKSKSLQEVMRKYAGRGL